MNYYKRHIGDYAISTMHLSILEHGAYGLLLDRQYLTEQPIPAPEVYEVTRARTRKERMATDRVLREFYVVTSCGSFTNRRVEREIAEHKECSARAGIFWKSIPRHVRTAMEAARRARKLDATPDWLTQEHIADIEAIYRLARSLTAETGTAHDVDHIVPLQGKNVCGLHVPWNLRAIPAYQNRQKGAAYA